MSEWTQTIVQNLPREGEWVQFEDSHGVYIGCFRSGCFIRDKGASWSIQTVTRWRRLPSPIEKVRAAILDAGLVKTDSRVIQHLYVYIRGGGCGEDYEEYYILPEQSP